MHKITPKIGLQLLKEVEEAVASVAARHGLVLGATSRFLYSANDIEFKNLCMYVPDATGTALSKEEKDYDDARQFNPGLPARGTVFTHKGTGKQFKILYYKYRSYKNPIVAEQVSTGAKYKFSIDSVLHCVTK